MLDLMNRIHPEPELDGFTPRLSHGPKPVIPLLPVQPRWPFGKLPPTDFAIPAVEAAAAPFPTGTLPRLRLLRKAFAERPEGRINMRFWCGTICCAAGSYVAAHPNCGLVFRPTFPGGFVAVGEEEVASTIEGPFNALGDHFGMSLDEARDIFGYSDADSARNTKAAVLARIDAFIADKEAGEPDADEPSYEMEFSADDGYAGPVRDPSPAPEDRDGGSYACALRDELNAALSREGELATANARLRGERDELARELSRRAMARV